MKSVLQVASLLSVPLLCLSISCAESQAHSGPSEYDLQSPIVHKMDSKLAEISGIAFKPGDDSKLYAVEDEHANFYRLSADGKIQAKIDFGKKGDYEDLAITDSAAYDEEIASTEAQDVLPPGEYEGMSVSTDNSLVALCKDCKMKGSKGKLILYKITIEPSGELKAAEPTLVAIGDDKNADTKTKLSPSGIARNPLNGHWYIVSSVNKLLIVLNQDFSSPVSYKLNPKMFPQPEGICFDSKGTLFISNEAAGGSASILEFRKK
jgi:uncharacterized protein YjiK